ncbi:hypothetical protein GCM10028805_56140 [Spirosoma harenae]
MDSNETLDGEVVSLSKHLMAVRTKDVWGFARPNGDMVLPPMFDAYMLFFYGLIAVQFDGLWGFLDEQGREIVPPHYEEINFDSDHSLIHVVREGCHGFINRRAEEIIACRYAYCSEFSEQGFAFYVLEDKAGLLCADGRELTPAIYSRVDHSPSEQTRGLFPVERDDLNGFVNQSGEEVIPCLYDYYNCFDNTEHLLVQRDELWAIIDHQHRFYTDFVFTDWMYTHVDRALILQKEGKWGLLSDTGDEIIPIRYEAIHELKASVFAGLDDDGRVQGIYVNGHSVTYSDTNSSQRIGQ